MASANIQIEVIYATPEYQESKAITVHADASIEEAIHLSGVLAAFPEIDLHQHKVGIFSKIKKLNDKVTEGDRIEIYRELIINPKEARRLRSIKQGRELKRKGHRT